MYGVLYFTADDGVGGRELWKSNGSQAGTVMVEDIYVGISGSVPQYPTLVGDILFFGADDGVSGRELWALILDIQRIYLPLILRDG